MKSADDYNEELQALFREVETDFGRHVIKSAFDWAKSSPPFGKLKEISEQIDMEYTISGLFVTVIPLMIFCVARLTPQTKLHLLRILKKNTDDVIDQIESGGQS